MGDKNDKTFFYDFLIVVLHTTVRYQMIGIDG
jgi:hypothetical protein